MSDMAELRTAALQLRTELLRIAKELDELRENCVIASVAGSAIAVTGGVVAAVARLVADAVGLPVAVACTVAATGSLVFGGAHIAYIVTDKVTIKNAQNKLDAFKEKYQQTIDDPTLGVPNEEIRNMLTQIPRAYPLAKAAGASKSVVASASKSSVASASKIVVASASESAVPSASPSVVASASESVVATASTSVVASPIEGVAASCSITAISPEKFAFLAGLSVESKIAVDNLVAFPFTIADFVLSSYEPNNIKQKGDYIRDCAKALEDLERCCSKEIEREKIQALKEEGEKTEELRRKLSQVEEKLEEQQKKAKQKEKHMRETARKDAEKLQELQRKARQAEEERRERVRREKEELWREREKLQELRRQLLTAGKAKNTNIGRIGKNK